MDRTIFVILIFLNKKKYFGINFEIKYFFFFYYNFFFFPPDEHFLTINAVFNSSYTAAQKIVLNIIFSLGMTLI